MKKIIIPLIIVLVVFAAFGAAFFWWQTNTKSVSYDPTKVSFIIPKGSSATQVGVKLYREGLIRDPLAFKLYVQISGKAGNIQSGEFSLAKNMSVFQIVDKFMKGPDELWVTIPEGLRREEIAEKFITGLEMNSEQALQFREDFLRLTQDKEGYLFPDSYLFPKDTNANLVVNKLNQTFDTKTEKYMSAAKSSKYGFEKLITLASIIERETKKGDERPIVAGILLKRLDADWPLQADAAVQYALGSKDCVGKAKCDWWPDITKNDLELDSPYNTYKYTGMPSTPISNPGEEAINAAINPQESDYWFYLHDSDGNIHYAKDIEGHNANVAKYLGK